MKLLCVNAFKAATNDYFHFQPDLLNLSAHHVGIYVYLGDSIPGSDISRGHLSKFSSSFHTKFVPLLVEDFF